MVDESQNVPEQKPSFLDEVKSERVALEKIRDEIKTEIGNLEKLKAEDILSGRAPQPKQEIKKEISPIEYAQNALRNIRPEAKK